MTYVVAEIGGNHDGSLVRAKRLVDIAAQTGADAAKFQIYRASRLVHSHQPALPQAKAAGFARQIDRFRALEFTDKQWMLLIEHCAKRDIDFLASCFDLETLRQYAPYMHAIKIASGDLTFHDLIREAVEIGKPVWLSTGAATMEEIQAADRLVPLDRGVVMHCVSCYPTLNADANLGMIRLLAEKFHHVGYSDHTMGTIACKAAAAMGAMVIEKHFTDERKTHGDHPLSATPGEMESLVNHIRVLECMMTATTPAHCEQPSRKTMRRGARASVKILKGDLITRDNVVMLRPAGVPIDRLVGTKAKRDFEAGDAIR